MEKRRPMAVVGKCPGFETCRHNGQVMPDEFIYKMGKHVDFIPACPEMEIGLGVPRSPIRIVMDEGRKMFYRPSTGREVTKEMKDFSKGILASLGRYVSFPIRAISSD